MHPMEVQRGKGRPGRKTACPFPSMPEPAGRDTNSSKHPHVTVQPPSRSRQEGFLVRRKRDRLGVIRIRHGLAWHGSLGIFLDDSDQFYETGGNSQDQKNNI